VTPIENLASLPPYDKEKYKEIIHDAAETLLAYFGFDRDAYDNIKKGRRKKWYEELKEESKRYRSRDDLMPSVI
jgi:hypothetical protein